MAEKNYDRIGGEILAAARNELYMAMPFMDVALSTLALVPAGGASPEGEGATQEGAVPTMATDGAALYYNGRWLGRQFVRAPQLVNRGYLHVVFLCMLRHIWKARGKDPYLWDLACDTAVEALMDELHYPCIQSEFVPLKKQFIAECASEMKVVTAEGVYHRLLRMEMAPREVATLRQAFLVDDHGLWAPEEQQEQQKREEQDKNWSDIGERSRTAAETVMAGRGTGGETVADQIRVAMRDDVDYRKFLRRFAAPREIMEVDPDSFDYIFYTYGLQLYGNMPLVEPPETKEEKRIEDLVIAVDTSMSTSGALVKEFLACTWAILRSTETFTRKVNIRIIQCDDRVRADDPVYDMEQLAEYMEHFRLEGGSSTDFRPVFAHVDSLVKGGAFSSLRGLIYFTDGMGIYPKKRPNYDVAFVLLEEPPASAKIPAWAITLVLELPDLRAARDRLEEEEPELIDWDELPRT